MADYKVKTTAVINSNPVGSIIDLPKKEAERLFALGYVDIIETNKPKTSTKTKSPKKAAAPKKTVKESTKSTDKKTNKK